MGRTGIPMGFGNIAGGGFRTGAPETDQEHDKQTNAHRILCRIMTTTLLVGRFRGICRGISLEKNYSH